MGVLAARARLVPQRHNCVLKRTSLKWIQCLAVFFIFLIPTTSWTLLLILLRRMVFTATPNSIFTLLCRPPIRTIRQRLLVTLLFIIQTSTKQALCVSTFFVKIGCRFSILARLSLVF